MEKGLLADAMTGIRIFWKVRNKYDSFNEDAGNVNPAQVIVYRNQTLKEARLPALRE